MDQVPSSRIHTPPPARSIQREERFELLKAHFHSLEARVSEQEFVPEMTALMVEPHARGDQSASPRDWNPDDIVRIDEILRRGAQIELRKDPTKDADLPPIAAIALSGQAKVLSKSY